MRRQSPQGSEVMIAKIIKGTSFSGMITYMLGKREGMARILDGEGVRIDATSNEIAVDFNLQASMRPNIKKPVCHTILSFSSEDNERLDDDKMVDIAWEYLRQMGYSDTQYLIVRHMDREHPHLHICINRVDNYGNTISDSNEKFRSTKICRELTDKYHLKLGEGKTEVKRNRLRGSDKVRYTIYDAITEVLPKCKNWEQLVSALQKQSIDVQFKTKGKTDIIEGVVFSMGGVSFSGSHIDRSCSYSKLSILLQQNANVLSSQKAPEISEQRETESSSENFIEELFDSNVPAVDVAELVFQRKLRNQANKKLKRRRL